MKAKQNESIYLIMYTIFVNEKNTKQVTMYNMYYIKYVL